MFRVSRLLVMEMLVACTTSTVAAEDAFFAIPLSELKITSGELPAPPRNWSLRYAEQRPWVVLDGPGEAYAYGDVRWQPIVPEMRDIDDSDADSNRVEAGITILAPAGKDLTGSLILPKEDSSGMERVKFSLPASAANAKAREAFYRAKVDYYARLRSFNLPGAAWFRHQENDARRALDIEVPADSPQSRQFANEHALQSSYAIFSGGRAVSENLQLDRELLQRGSDDTLVGIDTLTGITVTEIDWKPLVKDIDPQLDPLAKLIPSDQHALFVPSVAAAAKLVEQLNGDDTVLFRLAEARIENAGTLARYERQLGLSLGDLPKELVATLALTGSDPYYRTGTDVAVLMETDQPERLAQNLSVELQNAVVARGGALPKSGTAGSLAYRGFAAPDRRLSTFVAELPGAVVVSNSVAQLERLASVLDGEASIASLDEYSFFRNRYPRGDKEETGFVFLSDPTIRRWCSPKWRIASGRRTRNAAVLAELQAQNAVAIATGEGEPRALTTDLPMTNAGELTLTAEGVVSTGQGTLGWMTPIIEMPIQQVTRTEANAYNAWREGYQRNWTWAFDPIGLRLIVADEKLAGDLTVMPLIAGSEYRDLVAVSQGAELAPGAGDPHGALAHAILALNLDSPRMQNWSTTASLFVPTLREVGPFSWLGSSVSMYVDDNPLWKELQAMTPEQRNERDRQLLSRLPIAIYAEVSSGLKLAAFLAGLRGFIEQAGPGLTVWEPQTYRDQPYVRVRATEEARNQINVDELAIYYSPSSTGLTVSLNEEVIKRAIDRRLDRSAQAKAKAQGDTLEKPATLPWLGSNYCLQVDRKALELAAISQGDMAERALQNLAWSNLPILNEWKRLFPDRNPIDVHERLWAARPLCPGGGEYVWNADWQTMESTVYGHPGEPRSGPAYPPALKQFQKGNFGVTFEEQGLRARAELLREVP